MPASFTRVGSLIVQQLNAAGSYTTVPSDPRFYTQGIKDAVLEADAFVCGVIISLPGNPYRGAFTPTSSAVAHLGVIPAHVGPILSVSVDGEGAMLWPKDDIEWERDNVASLTFNKHYWVDEDKLLHHNGTTATVTYFTFTPSGDDPPVLQAPVEFEEVIAAKALAFLINVEGENTGAAAQYDAHWKAALDRLLGAPSA